jgi:hypothetical protein
MKKNNLVFYLWCVSLKYLPIKVKRRAWNKGILLWRHKLWIRKAEFSHSLDIDVEAMLAMNEEERVRYIETLLLEKNCP